MPACPAATHPCSPRATVQDPTIQRMTEAIASDPGFMEMAKEMQESMLSGGMGGLNLGGEVGCPALWPRFSLISSHAPEPWVDVL